MDDAAVFRALADPSRRLLLDRLFERDDRTLGELEAELPGMTRFGVMKHLRVLEEAGLVTARRVGREKHHHLNPVPIRQIHDRWLDKFTAQRAAALAELKNRLEGVSTMEAATVTKPVQVYQMVINVSPERVWEGITSPEFTTRYFFGSVVESTLEPGTPIRYHAPDRSAVWVDGEVLECDPPKRLVHTWRTLYDAECADDPASRVTWELESVGEGMTKLTATHEFDSVTKTYENVSGGWSYVLSSLKTLLETGEPLPPLQ